MSTELKTHRRQKFVLEIRFAAQVKRSVRAVVRTGTGTASSMAALIVHRPSPESETRPMKFESEASWARADAVKSSNHEAITLPRRHTSAMSCRSRSYW